jgi:hypothetical protein
MGVSAQELINNQVLDKCDFLVGVFWTRIGTPTTAYPSGTIEEIEKHINSGKPAMLYFSSQPVALDSVDTKQVEELRKFKESCKGRGLYESYDSYADFKEKFYRHLQLKLNEHPLFQNIQIESMGEIVESNTKFPKLAHEARVLLKEASLDEYGHILHVKGSGGTDIQTNGKNLILSRDRREVAKWEAALETLVVEGLLIDSAGHGEVFEVTNLGYQIADMIEL